MTAALLLGLGATVGFGLGDFLSGWYSRRHGLLSVLVVSQAAGLVVLLLVAPFSPPVSGLVDLAWGAAAGVAGALGGLLLLYGFRHGRLSVVSPISSVGAAGLPVVADLITGQRPSTPALVGIGVGLVAIWLVSLAMEDPRRRASTPGVGALPGLAAGIMFGTLFLALDRTDPASGAWPVISAQVAIVVLGIAAVLVRRQSVRIPRQAVLGVAVAGVATAVATASFLFAARAGFVSVAALLASMSPAVTVVLARWILAERLRPHQVLGLVAAGAALVLIGLG